MVGMDKVCCSGRILEFSFENNQNILSFESSQHRQSFLLRSRVAKMFMFANHPRTMPYPTLIDIVIHKIEF